MSVNQNTQTERRLIFLLLFIAVLVPLIFPIGWKTEVSPHAKMAYDMIDSKPEGSVAILSFDYEPSTMTELQPMATAIIEHAWSKGHKIIATALWPQGPQVADLAFKEMAAKFPDKVYGEDYVNLGYKPGGMVTIQAMGKSLKDVYPLDINGKKYDDLPIFKNIRALRDVTYAASLSSGVPGIKEWIMVAHDVHSVPVTGGTTAVSAPGFLPYINNQNQLYGLLGGLKAASEYEIMIGTVGPATVKMDAQSIAHLLILIFILVGNIKAWRIRHKPKQQAGTE